ncbi:hypothetical protein BO78DRAFT_232765 [Aspergillus sclerotiicarbonarius CBS 121057]|uniref:Zn(2)-C6 fungal-type domain-containing protein n=1 Tax=Aspergillus sclerotiicarbonarius (strain CBS 121057 / IBT 28362) TaxID=1448318 RepID=A0A319EST0_ASPSB|nr:hypothetical protein BO78DRAFT_232765 [Aspergillus sclerotiicarbonarius CBS 121057]
MPNSSSRTSSRDHSPAHQSSSKRRRVALACKTCRERKVRCDAARPVCGACRKRDVSSEQCEYTVVADTAKYQSERAYIQSLRNHIADLQGSIQQQPLPLPTPHDSNQPVPCGLQGDILMGWSENGVNPHNQDQVSGHSNSLSAMGAPAPDAHVENDRDQFYGQPSLVSLLQQCAQASPGRPSQSGRLPPRPSATSVSTSPSFVSSVSKSISSMLSDDYSLPPRKVADWLLGIYFDNNHLFYPWVHKETFLMSYNALWSRQDSDIHESLPDVGLGGCNCPVSVFHCALNAMLAIACEFSSMRLQEKRGYSAIFNERMKSLMSFDIFDSGSVAHVQALLLIAIYLQCTSHPRRCWNVIGMAYRMAVGLGLHQQCQSDKLTAIEREIRWRAWCACVQMDIIVSMTMGRPPMTAPLQQVPLPSPVDDVYLSHGQNGSGQPTGTISTNQFLYENMRLISLLRQILLTVYQSTNPGTQETPPQTSESNFMAIIEIGKSLDEYESSLPPVFQWGERRLPESSVERPFRRQSNVLHARYLHLKLLLYRPALSEYCASKTAQSDLVRPDSWSFICQQTAASSCVRAACDLVNSLANATKQDATGAWWYGVYYLITAGIILALADSCTAPFAGVTLDQRETAWNQCLETLQLMIDVHPSARDYAIALSGLRVSMTSEQAQSQRQRSRPSQSSPGADTAARYDSHLSPGTAGYETLSPCLRNWDNELDNIMLPVHFLQELDDELLLPNLF